MNIPLSYKRTLVRSYQECGGTRVHRPLQFVPPHATIRGEYAFGEGNVERMARTISAIVISLSLGFLYPGSVFAQVKQIPPLPASKVNVVCSKQIPPAKVAQGDPSEVCKAPGVVQKLQWPIRQKPQNFPTMSKPQKEQGPNPNLVCKEKYPSNKVEHAGPPEMVCKKIEPRQKPVYSPGQKPQTGP
jgi:hypothetical protein